jgi:DNA-directed RNA polymerase specialized sigma24 family protein
LLSSRRFVLFPRFSLLPWTSGGSAIDFCTVREPSEDELDRWMSRLSQGEREAFDPLFRALYPRAVRFAQFKLSEEQAADTAQLILMKLFAEASAFEAGRPVLPWFYAIAANEVQTVRRRCVAVQKRTAGEDAADSVPTAESPESLLLERELHRSLETAIASLDEESAEAISCMLNRSVRPAVAASAFRKRVSRAYARLRWLLGGVDGK